MYRFVSNLEVHEWCVGLYSLQDTTAATLYRVIKDVLLRLEIPITSCRGTLLFQIRYNFFIRLFVAETIGSTVLILKIIFVLRSVL